MTWADKLGFYIIGGIYLSAFLLAMIALACGAYHQWTGRWPWHGRNHDGG